jgi:hypothetical protein
VVGLGVGAGLLVGAAVGPSVGKGQISAAPVAEVSALPFTLRTLIAETLTPTKRATSSFIGMQWSSAENSAAFDQVPHILYVASTEIGGRIGGLVGVDAGAVALLSVVMFADDATATEHMRAIACIIFCLFVDRQKLGFAALVL